MEGTVDRLKDYSISFKGLKDGLHKFEYQIGASFFGLFKEPLVENGKLNAVVTLNKSQKLLIVDFDIKGTVNSICDKCLGPLEIEVESSERIYFNFGIEYAEQSEEIIVLPYEEHQINVAQWIYEFIILNLPLRHVHADDENGNPTCDAGMIEKLGEYIVGEDKISEKKEGISDPRWDALKKLINK
jgi:uncharacterized metal-binding protein YceD (DUF177 family)